MKHIDLSPNKRFPKRKRVYTINDEPSLTDQSQQEECDINNIVARHYKDRIPFPNNPGMYQDVSQISDLQGALNDVRLANEAFEALPSQLREKLYNDPKNLITYLNDKNNHPEAEKYGLLKLTEIPATMPKESAPPKPPKKKSQNNDNPNDDK